MIRIRTAALAAAALSLASATAAETRLVFERRLPLDHAPLRAIVEIWVGAANGALKKASPAATVALSAPRAQPTDPFESVRLGAADLALIASSDGQRRAPLLGIAEIPLVSKVENARAHSAALWRTHRRFFAAKDEFAGVRVLGLVVSPPDRLFSAKKEVRSLAETRGLKILAGPGEAALVAALGGVAVARSGLDPANAFASGAAEAMLAPNWAILGFDLAAPQHHLFNLPGGFRRSVFVLVANAAKWQSLPPQLRQALEAVSGEGFALRVGEAMDLQDARSAGALAARGVKIAYGGDEAWDGLTKRMPLRIAAWMEAADKLGIDGKAAFDFYQREIARALNR